MEQVFTTNWIFRKSSTPVQMGPCNKQKTTTTDLPRMMEKQYQQRELQGLKFLAHIGLLLRGGGRSEAVFLSTGFLCSLLFTKVSLYFFEILFYFSFIHIATHIFALPCHNRARFEKRVELFVSEAAVTLK